MDIRGRAETVDQDAIEKAMIEFSDDVAVGLVISPKEGHKGGYCYKLLLILRKAGYTSSRRKK